MNTELRDYQQEAVDALFDYWESGLGKNPLVCAPTGSGKSVIMAEFERKTCVDWPDVRIMCITDSRELIEQNEKQLRKHWVDASTGAYSAGLGRKQTAGQITFAGIQSVYNKAFDFDKIDIVIVDECHMIPRKDQTRYGTFLKDMLIANPDLVVIGFTATPYRLDSGVLHEGKGAMFDGIAYVCEMKKLISEGYLVPVVSRGGVQNIDLSEVHVRAGEYAANELAHAADDPILVELAVKEIVQCGHDRKAWLIFASGVQHAEHVAEEIRKYGIKCEVVTGETPHDKRDSIVKRFKDGAIQCMVNVAIFTKGFDAPRCDMIALLMATKSTGRYVQIVGRGMRPYPGKEDCLLLDYGQNVTTHGMIDAIDPVRKKDLLFHVKRAPPTKICPKCSVFMHARTKICPGCGYEFPVVANHGTVAYEGAVLSSQQKAVVIEIPEEYRVLRHKKEGKPDSVRVIFCDNVGREHSMWLALDHGGYAAEKARAIVKQFGGSAKTVNEALQEYYYWRKVTHIKIVPKGKFDTIVGFVFEKNQSTQQSIFGIKGEDSRSSGLENGYLGDGND